ncbi:MAG: type I-E CRISPR-associated protein Cas6/Cse3/CasE [Gemmatimonadota bacterium]
MNRPHISEAVLALDPARAARGATRPYLVHQLVADLFGEFERRPFLYREQESKGTSQTVLILSSTAPLAPEEVPVRDVGVVRSIRSKPFVVDVPPGTMLDFEIRLNATKDVPTSKGARSKRMDVWEAVWQEHPETTRSPEQVYGEYLQRKLDGAGKMGACALVARGLVRARKQLSGPKPITFVAADLIGTMEVTDPHALVAAVSGGMGRAKAFGCGLMCLSRPGTVLPRRHPDAARELYG